MDNKKTIVFNANLENLQLVRDFVRNQLDSFSFDPIEKNKIVLAVDEVCSNLILHSNLNDHKKKIALSFQLIKTPKGLSIELTEKGIPFDYNKYTEPKLEELKNSQTKGKLGLMLVRRIMDKIEYLQIENQNVCRLYKSLA